MVKIAIVEQAALIGNEDFLVDKSMDDLRLILEELGVDYKSTRKMDLVHTIMQHTNAQEEDDLTGFNMFEIRYVGRNGVVRMNAQSIPGDEEYNFYHAQWVQVDSEVYWHFYKKISRSIDSGQVPHWQARRQNAVGKIVTMFTNAFNKIASKPPSKLSEVKNITAEHIITLTELNIGSIPELLRLPKSIIEEKLYLNPNEVEQMFSDARRSF